MYKKILVIISFFSFQLVQTSAAASTPGGQLEVQDVLEVAQASFKDVQKITFSPDGKYAAILLKDNSIVVRKTDDLKKECYTHQDHYSEHDITDIIFGGKSRHSLYYRHGSSAFYNAFNADEPTKGSSFECDAYYCIADENKNRVTLLLDPQDFSCHSSMISPLSIVSEKFVLCPKGPVTTRDDRKVIREQDGTLVSGMLMLCKHRMNNRLFCINICPEQPQYALSINTTSGRVEKKIALTSFLEYPGELLFDTEGSPIIIETAWNKMIIYGPDAVISVPDVLTYDINERDQLVVATNNFLLLLSKNKDDRYKKEKEISHEVENAIVRFNVPGDMIIRLSFDKKDKGLGCTIFNLELQQLQKLNIESLGFSSVSYISFPKSNPALAVLVGRKYGAILQLPEIKKESDAGGEA